GDRVNVIDGERLIARILADLLAGEGGRRSGVVKLINYVTKRKLIFAVDLGINLGQITPEICAIWNAVVERSVENIDWHYDIPFKCRIRLRIRRILKCNLAAIRRNIGHRESLKQEIQRAGHELGG